MLMGFKFSTDAGRDLCRQILRESIQEEPHEHQLDVITKLLDRVDVLSLVYTGGGKSGYIYMTLKVILKILECPSLCPEAKFRPDPIIVVVCPTTALEQDLEFKMRKYDIPALVINKEQKDEAAKQDKDLFAEARKGYNVILVTPEMLSSPSFGWFIHLSDIIPRLFALMIDEVHLLHVWGPAFRPEYMQIGHLRKRFPEHTVMAAFTATLWSGQPRDAVCHFLGLHSRQFHFVQRSNARYDIRLSVKLFPHRKQSERFPELDWILQEKGKILIYHRSIKTCNRILHYLRERSREIDGIRMYNALHSKGYNDATMQMLCLGDLIIIATDTLSVGIDVPDIDLCVVIDPLDLDDALQKVGRAGRNRTLVSHPRGVIYLPKAIFDPEKAEAIIDDARTNPHKRLDVSLPKLVLAPCKLKNIDEQYGNKEDESCGCASCKNHPRPPFPSPCTCSGCDPWAPPSTMHPSKSTASTKKSKVPFAMYVTKAMWEVGLKHLERLRDTIMEDLTIDEDVLPVMVLSPVKMERILNALEAELKHEAVEAVAQADELGLLDSELAETPLLKPFLEVLINIHQKFEEMRNQKRAENNTKAQAHRQRQKAATTNNIPSEQQTKQDNEEANSSENSELCEDEESEIKH
ncbi:hypothetical protein VNI00_017412 [Paramarasmius palmivorus]|uniref:DNA 3'-5' helicase n=1 Tax=Paramarasmius palmivorus TaxID=297713 RepID=A0AAW0B7R0_9AGAR